MLRLIALAMLCLSFQSMASSIVLKEASFASLGNPNSYSARFTVDTVRGTVAALFSSAKVSYPCPLTSEDTNCMDVYENENEFNLPVDGLTLSGNKIMYNDTVCATTRVGGLFRNTLVMNLTGKCAPSVVKKTVAGVRTLSFEFFVKD